MINTAKLQTFSTSHRTLKILAVTVWLIGGTMLARKAGILLTEAHTLHASSFWIWSVVLIGISAGTIKSCFIFRKACKKNLARIDAIEKPKLWQFFRPGFFIALALMIATGSILSRVAHGNITSLLSVAALDVSIATGLLGSSPVFLEEKAFMESSLDK